MAAVRNFLATMRSGWACVTEPPFFHTFKDVFPVFEDVFQFFFPGITHVFVVHN